jgi:predicted metal-binding membrane protein
MGREHRADGGDGRRPRANPGSLAAYAITWTVMMIAMMLPSAMRPVLEAPGADRRTAFAAGYLAVCVLAGLLGYAALRLGRLQSGSFGWDRAGRPTAATVLLAAAAFELTPLKRRLLMRCGARWPAAEARRSALRRGLTHGGSCLVCCAGLTVALFALGEMSVTWMAVLTAVIAAQKLLPWRTATIAATSALLLALGAGLAAAPAQDPELAVPGTGAAMHGMRMPS